MDPHVRDRLREKSLRELRLHGFPECKLRLAHVMEQAEAAGRDGERALIQRIVLHMRQTK